MFQRIKKVDQTRKFVNSVEKELLEKKNTEWRGKIEEYVHDNERTPYAGSTVIFLWCSLSEMLRKECYYKEAVLVGELAVLHSRNLTENFRDMRIKALYTLGLAQVECMMFKNGIAALENAWGLLNPTVHSYDALRLECGMGLSYAYAKYGKHEESQKTLDFLEKWILEEKPSCVDKSDWLMIKVAKGNDLLMQQQYQKGLHLIEKAEKEACTFHMQNEPVYYKILALHGLFEKMNNHPEQYYKLTKQAITYAKQAGDIEEEYAYRVNLLDALDRLGKNNEMVLRANDIFSELEGMGQYIESLNLLQNYMTILLRLAQEPQMLDEIGELVEKAQSSWKMLKDQGIDYDSRDALKIQEQFSILKLLQKNYEEADEELSDCLKRCQEVLGAGDIDTLSVQDALARSKRMQGDLKGALALYLDIEKLRRNNGQEETHSYFETLRSIAYMYYFIGEKQEAMKRILLYFDKIDRYSYEVFLVFDEAAWKAFSDEFQTTLHDVLGWLAASPELNTKAEEIYQLVLRFKNRIYDEEMLWKSRKKSAVLSQKLTEYYDLLKTEELCKEAKEKIEFLSKKSRLEEEISQCQPELSGSCATLGMLRKNLNQEEAIADYIIYNKDVGREVITKPEEGYLVFVITKDSINFYNLEGRRGLDYDMMEFYQAVSLYNCKHEFLEQQLIQLKAGLGILSLDNDLNNIKKIYLGLDGEWMPRLPWHYICSEYEVQVLPSFMTFEVKVPEEKYSVETDWKVDFFGNPSVPLNEENNAKDISLLIAQITKVRLTESKRVNLHTYEGKTSNKSNLAAVASPDILHVAAHGCYASEDNRLQKSIILLSGTEDMDRLPQNIAEFDGAVTMLDIMQMELSATGLVVLDSCESGIGYFRKDEGVYGFARAFFIAGAGGVLSCLWKVDALFSVIFLDCFYKSYFISGDMEKALAQSRNMVRKMTKADILYWLESRRTRIEEMESGAEIYQAMENIILNYENNDMEYIFDRPAYWACFVLSRPGRIAV